MTEFYGTMTVENAEEIMNLIYEKIKGRQYVFVSVNEGSSFGHHVETRQSELRDEPHFHNHGTHAHFNFNDVGYVWGLSTTQTSGGYDPKFYAPYVVIEYKKVLMTHRAPAGHLLHWQIFLIDEVS